MGIVKRKLLLVTIAVADPGGGGGAQGAQANSDNAKFFIAKYCGKQNNVKKWNNNLRKYNKTAIIT